MTFDRCSLEDGIWRLDELEDPEEDEDAEWATPFTKWMETEFMLRRRCPSCGARLKRAVYSDEENGRAVPDSPSGFDADLEFLWWCRNCAYWQWFSCFENRGIHGTAAISVLREFDPSVPEGCLEELGQHLRRNARLWHELKPDGMERLVAALFKANFAPCEVMHVGRPGDLGVDVLFVDSGGRQWLIQVKRRERPEAVEGFETLQKLLGTLALEGQKRGIIASNANHFSYQAEKQANRASNRGLIVEFFDRGKLNRLLSAVLPNRPWRGSLKENGVLNYLEQRLFGRTLERRDLRDPRDPNQLELF